MIECHGGNMENYKLRQIENLSRTKIDTLVIESQNEGFHFLNRLVKDYENGTNKFDKPGEALYSIFDVNDKLIAIGGINVDPFSKENGIGRLRRFYVGKAYRRKGLGRILVQRIINHTATFRVIVLNTDTEQGDLFYKSLGFEKEPLYSNSTHYLKLR
jgi:GNAT superfamily N-acetyltransferase